MIMIQIIIAAIGFLAAVITASISYYFTKKNQSKMEERKLKEEYYRSFIKALSDVAIDNFNDEAQKRLSEGFNSLIVIASPNVVQELMEFHNFIRPQNTILPKDSAEWLTEHDNRLRTLVKAMREDIFGKEKNIDKYISQVHLVGKAPKKKIRIKMLTGCKAITIINMLHGIDVHARLPVSFGIRQPMLSWVRSHCNFSSLLLKATKALCFDYKDGL